MPNKQVKIVLLTGYLGAGKTTLLNHILSNDEGIRAAVIVNDIGEVNVDASLIKNGGLSQTDDLIPMTNGCICCTLSGDLANQLQGIAESGNFDYIIIEASGICEPIPIAYTISSFCDESQEGGAPLALDNIVAVVDARRMLDEFNAGEDLLAENIGEDDIEALLIQQIEFCSTLILNKADLVTPEELAEVRAIVRALQKEAVIVEATEGNVPMSELLDTGRFSFEEVYNSAAWLDAMEGDDEDEHDEDGEHHEHDEHDGHDGHHGHEHHGEHEHGHRGHGHHHHHHHDHAEFLEYEISTFVYKRRRPLDIEKLSDFVSTWDNSVIRSKGQVWAVQDPDMCYLFEQAGKQARLGENGLFLASAPEDELEQLLAENPEALEDWDPVLGDRMTKLVFIGRHMDREALIKGMDDCLVEWTGPVED